MPKVKNNPECKKCRRAGEKLFLKGSKCFSPKCLLIRRNYAPGAHGSAKHRVRLTGYGEQLKEKQKAKRIYGLREKQFSNYVAKSSKQKGNTAEVLLRTLETRLDNVVYRLGLAKSRAMARQMVTHAHFLVNDKKVDIPSFQVKPNQVITIKPQSFEKSRLFENSFQLSAQKEVPSWLALEANWENKKIAGKVLNLPKLEEISKEFDPKKIIEFYSR